MNTEKTYYCSLSGNIIPQERVEFLQSCGVPEEQMTCVQASQIKKIKVPTNKIVWGSDGVDEEIEKESSKAVFEMLKI